MTETDTVGVDRFEQLLHVMSPDPLTVDAGSDARTAFDRLAQARPLVEDLVTAPHPTTPHVQRLQGGPLVDVGAAGEGLFTGAGQNDDAYVPVIKDPRDLHLIVAGGWGPLTAVCHGWGGGSRAVHGTYRCPEVPMGLPPGQ